MRCILLAFLAGLPLAGMAQAPNLAPTALSLAQAITLAQATQGTYQNLLLDEQVAAQTSRATRSLYRPQVSAATDVRYNPILPTNILPNLFNLASDEKLRLKFGTTYQASAGITLTQRVYNAGTLAQRRIDAINEQLAANATRRGNVTLVQNLQAAYYEALLRETQLAFAQADVLRTNTAYQDILERWRAGRALATDAASAYLNERNAALALDLARQRIPLSKQNLLSILGLPADPAGPLRLTDSLPALLSQQLDTLAWTTPQLLPTSQRPELRQEQLNGELATASLQAERQGYRPTVSLVGYLGANGYDNRFAQSLDVTKNWYGNSYVALQASVPLLDGGARNARIVTQRLRLQQAQHRQNDLQQTILYEVANARTQLQQAWQTLRLRRENVAVATQSASQVYLRQQADRAVPREALDAEVTQQQAQRDYLQAVYDLLAARLEYDRAIGTLAK